MQNASIGTLLVTLSATDPDYQLNALVAYSFENNSGVSGPFELDRETGELWTRETLDREQTASYSVSIYIYVQVLHIINKMSHFFCFMSSADSSCDRPVWIRSSYTHNHHSDCFGCQ